MSSTPVMSSVAANDNSIVEVPVEAAVLVIVGAVVSRIMSSLYVFVVSATPLKRTYTTLV